MSWSDRRLFLIAMLAVSACGFAPAYGPDGAGNILRGQVDVPVADDLLAFNFVTRFQDRLGRAGNPRWRLDHVIIAEQIGVGVNAESAITRYNVTGAVDWSLVSLADEKVVLTGRAESFTSYSTTGSTVATQAAETAALERLMQILADQVVARLIAAAPGLAP